MIPIPRNGWAAAAAAAAAAGLAVLSAGCSGDGESRCEEAFAHVLEVVSDELGEEAAASMEAETAESVDQCETHLDEEPETTGEALDCVLEAESTSELQECPQEL